MNNSDLRKPPRPRQRLLGAITAVISLILTLLVLEVCARFFMPGARDLENLVTRAPGSDSRAYLLKPGARVEFRGIIKRFEKPIVWQVNAQGIRSDRPVPPKSDRFRIATFGDSEAFGWSMPLALTFQKRMERIDDSVEVINFGTPGYNAENVADNMQEVLANLEADFVIYIAHKNDRNPPLTYSPILSKSYLLIGARFAYYRLNRLFFRKPEKQRYSPESFKYFAAQVDRMIDISRGQNLPLLVSYLSTRIPMAFPQLKEFDFQTLKEGEMELDKPGFRIGTLNLEHGWKKFPRVDFHMGREGHQETAEKFCALISGRLKNSCVPPFWKAGRSP